MEHTLYQIILTLFKKFLKKKPIINNDPRIEQRLTKLKEFRISLQNNEHKK